MLRFHPLVKTLAAIVAGVALYLVALWLAHRFGILAFVAVLIAICVVGPLIL